MEYLVAMVNNQGRTKYRVVEAQDCKQAETMMLEKFPSYDVTRISSDAHSIEYYSAMKKTKNN